MQILGAILISLLFPSSVYELGEDFGFSGWKADEGHIWTTLIPERGRPIASIENYCVSLAITYHIGNMNSSG